MENLIGQRIRELRNHYNLGLKEFSEKCGLSHVAIFHIENGTTLKPHKNSIHRIATTFGTSADWIYYGLNTMLPLGSVNTQSFENEVNQKWMEEAYMELKSKNVMLEKEVDRLWQVITHLTSDKQGGIRSVMKAG